MPRRRQASRWPRGLKLLVYAALSYEGLQLLVYAALRYEGLKLLPAVDKQAVGLES